MKINATVNSIGGISNPDFSLEDSAYTAAISALGFNGAPLGSLIQPDGKLIVFGTFTSYGGDSSNKYLIRFNENGTVDTSFRSNMGTGFNGSVYGCTLLPSGHIIAITNIATTLNGVTTNGSSKIATSGSPDLTFTAVFGNSLPDIVGSDSAGNIYYAGQYSMDLYNGTFCNKIFRTDSNGVIDTAYNSATAWTSGTIDVREGNFAFQADGKLLLSGIGAYGIPNNGLLRVNVDGSRDVS